MNTMRMPGFSAEASLYRSSKHYQAGAMLTGLGQGGEVVLSRRALLSRRAPVWCYDLGYAYCCCSRIGCCCDDADGTFCWSRVLDVMI